jgi:hypothetical protein
MLGRLLDESTIPGSLLSVYVVEESRDPIEVHELGHCTDYASFPVSKRRLKDSHCLPLHLAARAGDTAADLN